MYTSNGPLLCRSAFKRKLKAISVLVSTPQAAVNMFQHGFINSATIHTVIIHAAGSISMTKQDTLSTLYRDWLKPLENANLVFMSSKLSFVSPALRDCNLISRDPNDALPPVQVIEYSSISDHRHLSTLVNSIRKRSYAGMERPILRRYRDSILRTARNWGTIAAREVMDEFVKRFDDEKGSAFAPMSGSVLYHMQETLQTLERFRDSLFEDLKSIEAHSSFASVRVNHIVRLVEVRRNSFPQRKFVIVVRTKKCCRAVVSLLKKAPEFKGVSELLVELGEKIVRLFFVPFTCSFQF